MHSKDSRCHIHLYTCMTCVRSLTQKYEIDELTSCTKKNCALSNGAAFNLSSIIGNLMTWPSWGC